MNRERPRRGVKSRRPLGFEPAEYSREVQDLLSLRQNDPPCVCGKERYYSEEAAKQGLERLAIRRIVQVGEVCERDYYLCKSAYNELGVDIWHLTSNNGFEKNPLVKERLARRGSSSSKGQK